ncbi:g12263 [Coccomyxa viridis]|uniref:G12263 protein n=1 Tax=Coccomyxa viridis TaxID=1274662 RepID=A0ABP1GGY4_9CHLO
MADTDAAQLDLRTVFVKGVSFDWDDKDFEGALSDIGPLRKCFLLRGAGKSHKGCGFATFALKEDAKRAVVDLNGKSLGGRTIQVEAAQKRAPFSERKEQKRKRSEADADPATAAAALDAQSVAPAKKKQIAAPPSQAANTSKETLPSSEAPKSNKARKDAAALKDPPAGSAPGVKPERKPKTMPPAAVAKQLLVRTVALGNLSPDTSAQALAYAQSATEVESVRHPSGEESKRHMLQQDGCTGDAVFLTYKTVKDAMSAVALLHNHVLQQEDAPGATAKGKGKGKPKEAPAAPEGLLLWARQVSGEGAHLKKWRLILRNLPFNVKEDELRAVLSPAGFVWELTVPRTPDGKARGFAFAGFMCRAHAEKAIKVANGQVVGGRTIAVDWAVSKAQFQSASAADKPGEPKQPEHPGLDSASDSADEDAMSETDEEGEPGMHLEDERKLMRSVLSQFDDGPAKTELQDAKQPAEGDKADGDDTADAESEGEEDAEEARAAGNKAKAQKIGGAPAEASAPTQDNVEATVFVRGLPLDTLQYELQDRMSRYGKLKACRLVKDKSTQKLKGTAFVEYERLEDAQRAADACTKARSGGGPAVAVRGVQLDIDLALTQDGARTLASGRAGTPSKDNRNLYLMKEGQIEEGSAAWQAMSAADQTKRKRAAAESRTKLKSPNFFVSHTRLCLRNLPHQISEKALKDLVIAAVKERASKAEPTVKQVKILRDTDKAGEAKPKSAKSKGFAFVELTDHEHALCALRQLNNNPVPFGTERRPVVEFAIENAQALKKRALRQTKVQEQSIGKRAPRGASDDQEAGAASHKEQRKRKRDDAEAPQKAGKGPADGQAPKEGRGQRQRRKKREGPGTVGQPDQTPSQPAGQPEQTGIARSKGAGRQKAVNTISVGNDRGQEAAGQEPTAKKSAVTGERKAKKRKTAQKGPAEKTDRLDNMVAQYKQQLFGGAVGSKTVKSSMQRWFE